MRRHTVLGSVLTELITTIPDTPPRAGQSVLQPDTLHHQLFSGGTTRGNLPSWPGSLLLPWLAMEEDSGVRQVRGCQIILTHKGRSTHYKVGLGRERCSLLNGVSIVSLILIIIGVMRFLQTEWHRHERDRNAWEIERAEMKSRIGRLEGDLRTSKRLHESLGKHVKMLELALKKERETVRSLRNGEKVEEIRDPKEVARENLRHLSHGTFPLICCGWLRTNSNSQQNTNCFPSS